MHSLFRKRGQAIQGSPPGAPVFGIKAKAAVQFGHLPNLGAAAGRFIVVRLGSADTWRLSYDLLLKL